MSVYQPVFERSARVAIQNTGAEAGKTSLALVVDLSSSMMFDEKGNIDQVNKPRWRRVRRAFEEVAKSLPVGVNISVRAFGPYGLGSQRISDPRVWQGFEREAARMQATLDKLEESLKLDQGTPLIRAIKDALDNDFDPRFEGFKSIIVLTDGGDSTLVEDTALQQALKTKKIDEAVKTLFPTPEISLRVIGIDPDKLTAKEQADLKPFKKAVVEVGGSYDAAESTAQIVEKLDEAVRRMRYTVEPDVGVSLPETLKKRAISISRGDKRPPENWSPEQVDFLDLDQISFLVRVQASRDFLQKVRLVPGDALFMDVAVEGDRLGLKRTVYADYLEQNRGSLDMRQRLKRSGDRDWVFSIIDMRKQERDLEMMAVIEKDEGVPDRRTETPVQQIRPQFVWFEVRGPGSDAPARLSVASRPFYPAPLWSLRCPRWDLVKEPQEPGLNAWWVESGDRLRPIARLLRNTHFASIEQVTNYPLQFTPPGENEITINVESMRLVTRDLNSEWEKLTGIPCLIVRMTYPPGTEPFFARIPDKRCGEWHRYYKAANKYVGVFWGVKFDPEGPLEIDLYSVADLKAKGLKIDPAKLTPPTVRPDPAPPDYRQISKRRSAN